MPGTWRSGGRPKPTALKMLQGARVRGRTHEPRPAIGRPTEPEYVRVDEQAHAHWERLCGELLRIGVLTKVNGDALGVLAASLADWDRIRAQLHAVGYRTLIMDGKRPRENPLLRRSDHVSKTVTRLLGEFGLTPSTQTRVHATPPSTVRASRYITAI